MVKETPRMDPQRRIYRRKMTQEIQKKIDTNPPLEESPTLETGHTLKEKLFLKGLLEDRKEYF